MASSADFPHVSTRQRDFVVGEVYHIFQRGTGGAKVFSSDVERALYLNDFFLLCRRYSVLVHNFVLMTTHIHFVLEPQTVNGISLLMRDLQGPHARQHNESVGRKGNLWTQHYGCKHVNNDDYYRKLMWYVEHNPVSSGRCKYAERYQWSGAQAHVANKNFSFSVDKVKVDLDLHFDRWRKLFGQGDKGKYDWASYLAKDVLDEPMRKTIEKTMDRRARLEAAAQERQRKRDAARKAVREFTSLVKQYGPGRAAQMMAEVQKAAETRAKAAGDGLLRGDGEAMQPS